MNAHRLLFVLVSLLISGCAPLLGALVGAPAAGVPPQAPAAVINISRGAIDFALNSFDAALYGLDFAMDAGKLTPGSDKAKQVAKAGRGVMQFLGMAEAARDAGNSASYDEAFRNANAALKDFRALIGQSPTAMNVVPLKPLSAPERAAVLRRLSA